MHVYLDPRQVSMAYSWHANAAWRIIHTDPVRKYHCLLLVLRNIMNIPRRMFCNVDFDSELEINPVSHLATKSKRHNGTSENLDTDLRLSSLISPDQTQIPETRPISSHRFQSLWSRPSITLVLSRGEASSSLSQQWQVVISNNLASSSKYLDVQ
ncbi:hypothetical protein K469DRAFT_213176 [Zopfia rhizophila CBS 207.26]|uniref:Uncharacterized protein n=1 Tax=Zopfia rhizophila CBS 207.26 TaxID=1314779 RepID=A0A6A6DVL7_9PEZI|nr:hypothetical protein K469DRAFT_213176 [Zopfia rhizophila CBS 207.26]